VQPPRLVVLGTGFAAFNLVRRVSSDYSVTIVSPRNHFLFTPLLPSTTVGTVEFRSIIEPIRFAKKDCTFYHAFAEHLDLSLRQVGCRGVAEGDQFTVEYDTLVIAVGAVTNTFQVPGVATHAHFLRELNDARSLRQHIIRAFERANLPGIPVAERQRLVSFVVCGGGPTGVEFAAELHDFLHEDLRRAYPLLVAEAGITLVEAGKDVLSTFDKKLRDYATALFRRQQIHVLVGSPVVRVDSTSVHLNDGTVLPFGLLLWSTGNGPTSFVEGVPLERDRQSRILTDRYFRVPGVGNVYALGDCSSVGGLSLPVTAQVAQQEGKYLASALNRLSRGQPVEPFQYRHLGMLAYIGANRALADLESFKGKGRATWLFWRSAYLSRIVSVKNKVLVLFDWIKAQIFGRDISQF